MTGPLVHQLVDVQFTSVRPNTRVRQFVLVGTQSVYRDFRHGLADIGKAQRLLDCEPTHRLVQGIAQAIPVCSKA